MSPSDGYYSFDHDDRTECSELTFMPISPIQVARRNHKYVIEPVPDTPMQTPQSVTQEPEGDYDSYHHAQMDPPTPKFFNALPPAAWAMLPSNGNAATPPPPYYPGYGFPYYPCHGFPPPVYAGYPPPITGPYTAAQAPEEVLPPLKRNEGLAPGDNDVLCGKGLATSTHVGSVQLRALLAETKCEYLAAKTGEKTVIARNIVHIIQSRGGRFLQKDSFGSWQPVEDEKAIIKKVVYLFTGI
jgi:hypothetical protein